MTINLSALFSTAAGAGVLSRRFFFASQNWVVPVTGTYRIQAWGGSGTGGLTRGQHAYTTGGGGAALCRKTVKLTAGDILTFVVGAGGAAISQSITGQYQGNDGGDTSVTATGIAMVAGGGKGGKASSALATILGGLGGIATGGDENLPGGRGGNITAVGSSMVSRATGGGGLPVNTAGRRGGDIAATTNVILATGGAGVGGDGGDIASGAGAAISATGGGGTITSALSLPFGATSSGVILGGQGRALIVIAAPGKIDVPLTPWFPYSGEGGLGIVAAGAGVDAGPGGGSGGACASSTAGMVSRAPGIFGGSGGCCGGSSGTAASGTPSSGANPFVGGSGGAATPYAAGASGVAAGGDGWIIVEQIA